MMKSLGAAVRISNRSPPASRTASFTTLAIPSRWLKQIASSDELFTTAIFGFSRSASVNPSAFHCARRTASRGDPGSKLLRSTLVIPRNLSQNLRPLLRPPWPGRKPTPASRRPHQAASITEPLALQTVVLVLRPWPPDTLLRCHRHRRLADTGGVAPGNQ